MGDPLSTDDAQETKKYDTLEGMIKYTTRDKSSEVPHTVWLEGWQMTEVDKIKNYLNTNRVEVLARAYVMGTDDVRENLSEDVEDLNKMTGVFRHISMNTMHQTDDVYRIVRNILEIEIPFDYESGDDLVDVVHVRVPESYYSEVCDDYVVDAGFGGWIHRVILGLGLSHSSNISVLSDNHSQRYMEYLVGGVDKTRERVEDVIRRYVNANTNYWLKNGIEVETYSGLEEILKHMQTDKKEEVETFLSLDTLETINGPGEPPPG